MAAADASPELGRRLVLREAAEVHILQEKCSQANAALDDAEDERDSLLLDLQRLQDRCADSEAERAELLPRLRKLEERRIVAEADRRKRDDFIRVLEEQNTSLSQALKEEEAFCEDTGRRLEALQRERDGLEHVAQQQSDTKNDSKHNLASVNSDIARGEAELRDLQAEAERLQEAEQRFLQQARAEMAPLEEKLRTAKEQHVMYLGRIQFNEARESRWTRAIVDQHEVLSQLAQKKKEIEAGRHGRSTDQGCGGLQREAELQRRKELLEQSNEILRQSLNCAEEQLDITQGGTFRGAHGLGLASKVEALTEQLRHSQEALERKRRAGSEKSEKLAKLEAQGRSVQDEHQSLVDARLEAETKARSAGHTQEALLNKNRLLEEGFRLARMLQEQAENRLKELKAKEVALRSDNEFLVHRIDGFEDDRTALLYELRRQEDEEVRSVRGTAQMRDKIKCLELELTRMKAERDEVKAEIDFIRDGDMLDEYGRVKPILLESESKLLESLQINDFLLHAQAERNPVPLLAEKISEILGLLHTALAQADLFQEYVQDSHRQQTRLRQKNLLLDERVELCEAWKRRALQKIVCNEFESRQRPEDCGQPRDGHLLYLDCLEYHDKELEELCRVIRSHEKQDEVKVVSLRDNLLDGSSVPILCELLELCPYIRRLDLRHNKLDEASVNELEAFVSKIPGTSSCEHDSDSGDLTAKSGAQVRLVVSLGGQRSPVEAPVPDAPPFTQPCRAEDLPPPTAAREAPSPQPLDHCLVGLDVGSPPSGAGRCAELAGLTKLGGKFNGLRSPSSASTRSLASTQLRSPGSTWSSSTGSWTSPSSSRWWSREGSSASSTPSSTSDRSWLRLNPASPSSTGGRSPAASESSRRRGHLDRHMGEQTWSAGPRTPSSGSTHPNSQRSPSPSGAGAIGTMQQHSQRRPRSSASGEPQSTSPPSPGSSAATQLPPSPQRSPGQRKTLGSVVDRVAPAPTGPRRGTAGRATSASRSGQVVGGALAEVTLPRIASSVALSSSAFDPDIDIDL